MGVPVFQQQTSEIKFVHRAFQLSCYANSECSSWSLHKRDLKDKILNLVDTIYEFVDIGNETVKDSVAHREERLEYFDKAIRYCKHLKHELAIAEQVVHESKTGHQIKASHWETWLTYINEEVALLIGVQRKEKKELKELTEQEPTESERLSQEEVV